MNDVSIEQHELVAEQFEYTGALTVLTTTAPREQVALALGVDLEKPLGHGERGGDSATAWAIRDVPGGVFAIEVSGYGDPPSATLTSLAAEGGAAAVVRNNVQARMRFGCAKDGHVVFDADDYMYEDPSRVPVSLRPLFDLVHDDLTGETDDDAPDEFAVGLAMSEVITGIRLSADDVAAIQESRFFMVEAAGH